jgi:hypothetical protein
MTPDIPLNYYEGEDRRTSGTCQAHEAQAEHIQTLALSVRGLVVTIKIWGSVALLVMGLTSFLANRSINLIGNFLSRVEAVETKQAAGDTQIAVNTHRLNILEEWRYDHIMDDKARDERIRQAHEREAETSRRTSKNERELSANARRWGIVNEKLINTNK